MTSKYDGGPAFPRLKQDEQYKTFTSTVGMALRDYFAAKALEGVFYPAIQNAINLDINVDCLNLAQMTYKMADAMLEARK